MAEWRRIVICIEQRSCVGRGPRYSWRPVLALAVGSTGTLGATTSPAWAIVPNASVTGTAVSLLSVSCAVTTACTAVGFQNSSGAVQPLAEMWNGQGWTTQRAAAPAGSAGGILAGVSCLLAAQCIAVGESLETGGSSVPLVEMWNGVKWTTAHAPAPAGSTSSELVSVSCVATGTGTPLPTACAAVGYTVGVDGVWAPLAESYNGTKWVLSHAPSRSGATFSELNGVSCVAASTCTAVGGDTNSDGTEVTLIETLNGTGWKLLPSANPASHPDPMLRTVSCTSPTSCVAVGENDITSIPIGGTRDWRQRGMGLSGPRSRSFPPARSHRSWPALPAFRAVLALQSADRT